MRQSAAQSRDAINDYDGHVEGDGMKHFWLSAGVHFDLSPLTDELVLTADDEPSCASGHCNVEIPGIHFLWLQNHRNICFQALQQQSAADCPTR